MKEKRIELMKQQYHYLKDILDRIDKGEYVQMDAISDYQKGTRQSCVEEVNRVVDILAELGNFEFSKMK